VGITQTYNGYRQYINNKVLFPEYITYCEQIGLADSA